MTLFEESMAPYGEILSLARLRFKLFPIVPGAKSPPKMRGWQEWATDDLGLITTWMDLHPDDNWGIFTGRFCSGALLVVDVDNKADKRGDDEILRLELEGLEFPRTFEQATPTGGRHLIYSVGEAVRGGANVLGPGLDIRSKGNYVVASGSATPAGSYRIVGKYPVHPAPQWLIERCGHGRKKSVASAGRNQGQTLAGPVDTDRARRRAIDYLVNEAPKAVEGDAGDTTTYKVAARLKDFGCDLRTATELLIEHWNDGCSPPWRPEELQTKVENAYRYGVDPIGAAAPEAQFAPVAQAAPEVGHPFDRLNREYAFVLAGGGHHILWETTDGKGRDTLIHLSENSFHKKYAAWTLNCGGKKDEQVTDLWMRDKRRRSYDGIVFDPSNSAPARFYNLWRGFAVQPAKAVAPDKGVERFLDHALHNVCHGDKDLCRWLIGYFAHLVQHPGEKPLTSLVFKGGKGVGKNALVERIGCLLGGHFLLTSNRRYLVGNFNGHLENLLLFALDEAFWSGDKQAEGQLKDLITGREHVIEHKGKEPYKVDNLTRVVVIGNEDWLIPASHDERRFAVFHVGDGRKQDRAYFEDMRHALEAGGYAVLLRYLLDFQLAGVDVNDPPLTAALAEQKVLSLDLVPQWWKESLTEGEVLGSDFTEQWPTEVETDRMRKAFQHWTRTKNVRGRLPGAEAIGAALKAYGGVKKGRWRTDGSRVNFYRVPSIEESRAIFERHLGQKLEWE